MDLSVCPIDLSRPQAPLPPKTEVLQDEEGIAEFLDEDLALTLGEFIDGFFEDLRRGAPWEVPTPSSPSLADHDPNPHYTSSYPSPYPTSTSVSRPSSPSDYVSDLMQLDGTDVSLGWTGERSPSPTDLNSPTTSPYPLSPPTDFESLGQSTHIIFPPSISYYTSRHFRSLLKPPTPPPISFFINHICNKIAFTPSFSLY